MLVSKETRQKIYKIPGARKLAWIIVDLNNRRYYNSWAKEHDIKRFWANLKKDRRKERCFIIGNGPSICKEDLAKLGNEDCFVSNRFCYGYDMIEWRPKYYVVQDIYALSASELNNLEASYCLFGSYVWRKNTIKKDNAWCIPTRRALSVNKIRFGSSLEDEIVSAYTVTFTIMQIAYYLGYKEVYLLGIDHKFPCVHDDKGNIISNTEERAHFFNEKSTEMINIEGMTNAYICAEKFAKQHDFHIYNCTRGGKLEVFQRKSLEEVLRC